MTNVARRTLSTKAPETRTISHHVLDRAFALTRSCIWEDRSTTHVIILDYSVVGTGRNLHSPWSPLNPRLQPERLFMVGLLDYLLRSRGLFVVFAHTVHTYLGT